MVVTLDAFGDESDYTELEELFPKADSEVGTEPAEEVSADLDLDLDLLLAESTSLATARRARARGLALSPEQRETLETARVVADANIWLSQKTYAHVVQTSCSCGAHFQTFCGWYEFQTQRKGGGRRLIRTDSANSDIPQAKYISEELVNTCPECLSATLAVATRSECDLLGTLGAENSLGSGQTELPPTQYKPVIQELKELFAELFEIEVVEEVTDVENS